MKYIAIAMMLLFGILVGCSAEAIETETLPLTAVSTVLAKEDLVEKTYISIGEVVPKNQIDVYANGFIEDIYMSVGDSVKEGDVILSLDKATVTSTFNSTESQLRTIRDNLKAQYDLANSDLAKQKTLLDSGIISLSQYEQTKSSVDSLLRQYTDARTNYSNQLNNLKDTVGDRAITSPIAGKIAAIYFNKGQTANNQMAVSIIDESVVYIKTFISSDLKRDLSVGDGVNIYVDGDHNELHLGEIAMINEIPDPQTKLFEVHVKAVDSYDYIIGEYAEIEYIIDTYMAILVPTSSIVRQASESYVFLLENGNVRKQKVTTGLTKGSWVEVKEISEEGKVLVRGQNNVIDGEAVMEVK
jgi:macrolide-specific efflux system membrane fusion protein